jgi:hypothetical protein
MAARKISTLQTHVLIRRSDTGFLASFSSFLSTTPIDNLPLCNPEGRLWIDRKEVRGAVISITSGLSKQRLWGGKWSNSYPALSAFSLVRDEGSCRSAEEHLAIRGHGNIGGELQFVSWSCRAAGVISAFLHLLFAFLSRDVRARVLIGAKFDSEI